MNTVVFVRRFLTDYARNPVNLLLLVVVPVVFVMVAAGSLVDAAKLFGSSDAAAVATATAGWAAGFLAGIAMYFQVSAARHADRGLVIAGLPARRLVAARLLTGLGLAVLASAAALVALQVRAGIDDPLRAVVGTLMFAVIYLGLGATIGALVRNPVNGTVLVLFVWILDVFFGPTMGGTGADKVVTRVLPTHFVSLWMTDAPLRHGGRLGDLGVAVAWALGALALAFTVVLATARVGGRRRLRARPGSIRDQLAAATRMGWRDWRRNPVLWLLLVAVPAVFILLAQAITPHRPTSIIVTEGGVRAARVFDVFDLHSGTMVPIAVASLAMLAGLFVVLDTGPGDRRLALVGLRAGVSLAARLAVVGAATALATGVSLGVAATVFDPRQWVWYAAANVLIAVTYALLGVLIAPVFGRVAGVFIAFLIPFLDVGLGQSPMLRGEPAGWAHYLPGYGAYRVLIDGGLTAGFDEFPSLLLALAWIAGLAVAASVLVRRTIRPSTG